MEQNKFYQIKNITEHEYTLVGCDGSVITRPIQDVDKSASVFTIQDAKDGDVLTCYSDKKGQPIEQTGIIKQYVGRHGGCSNNFKAHFGVDWDNNVVIEGYMGSSNIYPSTKEQRDTLMKAMADAGYTFDFGKKELKKIEQNSIEPDNLIEESYQQQADDLIDMVTEKPVWSEEDKEFINDLIGIFDGQQYQAHSDEEIVKWLKSIRLPYNKEWDENDEEMLKIIIATCELACEDRDSSPARHLLQMKTDWLKSLKDRVQPQPKQEWSEEDEKNAQ